MHVRADSVLKSGHRAPAFRATNRATTEINYGFEALDARTPAGVRAIRIVDLSRLNLRILCALFEHSTLGLSDNFGLNNASALYLALLL